MLIFAIPLKSKRAANNWEMVCMLFNRTLWSIYNQIDPNFKIIVACNEIPKLTHNYDRRLEIIEVKTKHPRNLEEQMIDKGIKTHSIACRIRQLGGGYVILADADDLYSNKLSQYVNSHQDENGWVIKSGYEYIWNKNLLKISVKHPPQPIVKYSINDLPEDMSDAVGDNNIYQRYIIRKGHGNIEKICEEIGRPLKKLPIRGHVYVKYTGENHSIANKQDKLLRRLSRYFMPTINLRKNILIKNEFSIDWIS